MPLILYRYVLRQALQAFLVGLFALTSIVFLGMAFTLVDRGYNIIQVSSVWPYVLLNGLPYAVPVALLCAVVMTFGRMSGDNEILAARSNGVWPHRLAVPALLLGVVLSGASFWLYQWALPTAYLRVDQFKETMFRMVINNLGVTERTYEIDPYQIYVHSVGEEPGEWRHVVIFHAEGGVVRRIMRAERGRSFVSEKDQVARVQLERCFIIEPTSTDKGLEGLKKWLAEDDSDYAARVFAGGTTSGPMDMTLDIDLSPRQRRGMNRPSLRPLPALMADIRERERETAQLPEVRRPYTERYAWEDKRNRTHRDLQREERSIAQAREAEREIKEELQALENQRAGFSSRRERLERDRLRHEERLGHLAEELAELERELERRPDEGERLEARLDGLAQTREALREDADATRRAHAEVDERLAELGARIAAKQGGLAEAGERLAQARAQAGETRAGFDALTEKHRAARAHQEYLEARMEFHSRNAAAFSCLAFVLIGVPLGIVANRGSLIYALAFSLGVVLLIYYPLTMVGQMVGVDRYLPAAAAAWAPVAVVAAVGVSIQACAFRR